MKRIPALAAALLLAVAGTAAAAGTPTSTPAPSELRRVVMHDGDTGRTLEEGPVRFAGYDTPEAGRLAKCPRERALAAEATGRASELTAAGVALRRARDDRGRLQPMREKWGRALRAGVLADGRPLAAAMIASRSADGSVLAVPYWGRGPRMDWCKQAP